jgi:uncharacterized protein
VRDLIACGAKVNDRNKSGTSALMTAASFGHKRVVAALLENGADRSLRNGRREMARDLALAAGHRDLAKAL